jgi:S1-C subfamily serine protease
MSLEPGHGSFVLAYVAQIERVAEVMGGIPVWEVLPNSAAESAGLAFGDIVLSINGTSTQTYQDFLAAGEMHLDNLEFEIFRNGRRLLLAPRHNS